LAILWLYKLEQHKDEFKNHKSKMNYDRIRSYQVKGQIILTYTQAAIILFNNFYL